MKIVIADSMEAEIVAELAKLGKVENKPKDLKAALADADVLLVRSATKVTEELLASAPKLKLVGRAGVGLDNVDADACKKRKVKVVNTPGASAISVAELTVGLIIAMLRHIPLAHHKMKQKIWDKKSFLGSELEGKKLGILGYGKIGQMVAVKAIALGMRVVAYDPFVTSATAGGEMVSLDRLFAEADIITLHSPLTPETANIIDKVTIGKMKQGVYIVNTARGGLIDEDALYEGCKCGKIAAAALDVYPEEPYSGKLLELENVSFTPHIAGNTKEAQQKIGRELIDRIKHEMGL